MNYKKNTFFKRFPPHNAGRDYQQINEFSVSLFWWKIFQDAQLFRCLAVLILFLSLTSCLEKDDSMTRGDATSEIYAAIDAKARECKNRPSFLLLIPDHPDTYGTRLCSLSIIRQSCPFDSYPLFCLEMYKVDLPGIGP